MIWGKSVIPKGISDTMQHAISLYEEWRKSAMQVELLKQNAIVVLWLASISLQDSDVGRITPRIIHPRTRRRITFWGKFAVAMFPLRRILQNWNGPCYKSGKIWSSNPLKLLFCEFFTDSYQTIDCILQY